MTKILSFNNDMAKYFANINKSENEYLFSQYKS